MNRMTRTPRLIFAAALLLGAGAGLAQDWPQWRGPNRDGKVAAFTAPKVWPKELAQKWKVAVGDGVATPALVGDKLYVFSRQDGNEILRCLEAATGKELWQNKYESQGASGPAASYSGPRSSPAVADGKVVTLGVRGMLSCVDAATGKKLWRKDDFQGATPMFCTSSSPIIVNGLCIAQLGGRNNGAVAAYDLASGEQKWKCPTDSPAYASLALLTVGPTTLIVAETEQKIHAIDAGSGKQVWETPFASGGPGLYNAGTPVVDGQFIIYSGGGRGTRAVRIDKEGDRFVGKELWKSDKAVQFNTPVVRDGMLFGLSQTNELYCLNMKTGQTAWAAPVGPAEAGAGGGGGFGGRGPGGRGGRGSGRGGYGSIVDAGAVLFALPPSGQLIAYAPADKYAELARIKVAGGSTYAHPVVSGNRIFIKDQDSVTLWTIE